MLSLLVLLGIICPISGQYLPKHGSIHAIPHAGPVVQGVGHVAPGFVAPGVVAQGVSQVAPGIVAQGVAQVAPGVAPNPYAQYYQMLMRQYQTLHANQHHQMGNPMVANRNFGRGAFGARQQVANLHHVNYNIFQNKKKKDYDYPPGQEGYKIMDGKYDSKYHTDYPGGKYPDGTYKKGDKYNIHDVYPDGKYPDGTYKKGDKYNIHDVYPDGKYPDGTYKKGDKHHHGEKYEIYPTKHHDKYPKDYSVDVYPDGGYIDPHYKKPKDYKVDKYSTDKYSADVYPDGQYHGIHVNPHKDKYDIDYPDMHYDIKHKDTYPDGYSHNKYPKDPKYDRYPHGKYPDGHHKGDYHDKYPMDYKNKKYHDSHIRPNLHHAGGRGGRDSIFEFGLPVSSGRGGHRRADLIGVFDDAAGHLGPHSRGGRGQLFSGLIPDGMTGMEGDLLDVGPIGLGRRRHGIRHHGDKYPDPHYKNGKHDVYPHSVHKYDSGKKYDKYNINQKYGDHHMKDYKYSTVGKYPTYPKQKDHGYITGEKYDVYPHNGHKYEKDYKYGTGQKHDHLDPYSSKGLYTVVGKYKKGKSKKTY